jgi:hypothetical protein
MGEHPLELETSHVCLERHRLRLDVPGGRFVVLAFRKLEQLTGVGNSLGRLVDFLNGGGEPGPLAT